MAAVSTTEELSVLLNRRLLDQNHRWARAGLSVLMTQGEPGAFAPLPTRPLTRTSPSFSSAGWTGCLSPWAPDPRPALSPSTASPPWPAPRPDSAILQEHRVGKAALLKGLCHKPPVSAPVGLAWGRQSWWSFRGFLRVGVLAGRWGREGRQLAEGQGVASPAAHEEHRRRPQGLHGLRGPDVGFAAIATHAMLVPAPGAARPACGGERSLDKGLRRSPWEHRYRPSQTPRHGSSATPGVAHHPAYTPALPSPPLVHCSPLPPTRTCSAPNLASPTPSPSLSVCPQHMIKGLKPTSQNISHPPRLSISTACSPIPEPFSVQWGCSASTRVFKEHHWDSRQPV